ncbi:MAG: transglycosylase family protein [Actinomycetota bacterium]
MSGSKPPSTSGSPCLARRARLEAGASITAIVIFVVMIATSAGASSDITLPETSKPSGGTTWRETRDELIHSRGALGGSEVHSQSTADATPASIAVASPPAQPAVAAAVAAPPPAPTPTPTPASAGDPNDPASWDRLAQCESGGNWSINTGNGYYGGLQFSLSSWRAVGGTGYPHEHSRDTQIEMGRRLHAEGGWSHWPACTRSFGWRQ